MEFLSFPGLSQQVTRGLVVGSLAVFASVGVCGLAGNIALIVSVIRQHELRSSPTYITLVSLALCDFVALLSLPFYMYVLYFGAVQETYCRWYLFGMFATHAGSIYHIVGFSILRYFILVKPFFSLKYITVKVAMAMCGAIWLVSFSGSAMAFSVGGQNTFNSSLTNSSASLCTIVESSLSLSIYLFVFTSFLPLMLITGFHATKAYYICHRKVESESVIRQQQVSTKVIVGIILTFTLSNMPGGIGWVVISSVPGNISLEAFLAVYFVSIFNYVNRAVNPFLYFLSKYRTKRMLVTGRRICS